MKAVDMAKQIAAATIINAIAIGMRGCNSCISREMESVSGKGGRAVVLHVLKERQGRVGALELEHAAQGHVEKYHRVERGLLCRHS